MRQLVGNLLDMLQVIYSYCEATRLDEEKEAFTVHQYNKQATSIFKSFYSNLCFLKYSLQMDPAKKIPEGKFGKCLFLIPLPSKPRPTPKIFTTIQVFLLSWIYAEGLATQ